VIAATNATGPVVAVVEDDLFFLSRIGPALSARGLTMTVIQSGHRLPPNCVGVLVDLTYGGDWESLVQEASAAGVESIAFGPHVDGDLLKRARRAGCSRVLARSKFATDLGNIVDKWAKDAVV
jgi:hypothetical protein